MIPKPRSGGNREEPAGLGCRRIHPVRDQHDGFADPAEPSRPLTLPQDQKGGTAEYLSTEGTLGPRIADHSRTTARQAGGQVGTPHRLSRSFLQRLRRSRLRSGSATGFGASKPKSFL